jgi:uncharacterized protein
MLPDEPDADPEASTTDGLDELMQLLADEGVDTDEGAEPESPEDEEPAVDAPDGADAVDRPRQRSRRGQGQGRRLQDEETFRDLESQLAAEPLEIKVDEDRLTATVGRVGPENTVDEIVEALRRRRIAEGDRKEIEAAVGRAQQGSPQYDIIVARGQAPVVRQQAHLRWHVPDEFHNHEPLPLASLQQALTGPSPDAVDTWDGVVHVVHAGDILVDIGPADYEEGIDVQGESLHPALQESPSLPHGERTALSEDGKSVVSTIYGYAGVVDGEPTVLPPIWMGNDSMHADFVCIDASNMPSPTAEEIEEFLRCSWIEQGVSLDASEALERLGKTDTFPRRFPLAQGMQPEPGVDGELKHMTDPSKLPKWSDLQSLRRSAHLEALGERMQEVAGSGRVFCTAKATDVLIERRAADPGQDGYDIRGEELPADPVEEAAFDLGEGVDASDDDLQAIASRHGIVCVHGNAQISVVSPLWLSTDRMHLCYLNLHSGARRWPSQQELEELASADPTLADVDLSPWAKVLEQLESASEAAAIITIATGTSPTPGKDATFDWAIEMGGRAGRILEDGSIDLRDRRLITVVAAEDVIGRWAPPTPGTDGVDVCGRTLAPPPPVDIEVVPDNKITSEPQDNGNVLFKALEAGGVSFVEENRRKRGVLKKRLRLGLAAVSEIDRDVDYSTGHVDFQGDVIIKGSVKPLFVVRASGSVTIDGNVEPGAEVRAGGEVCVGGGIVGEKTRVEAGGLVMAKFIQQATIRTTGDIEVGTYSFDASLRAGGELRIAGKGEGSGRALVGGMAWAAAGITVSSLGSPSNPNLRLVVGIDPQLVDEADRLRGLLRACDEAEQQALAELGLKSLDAGRIRQKLEHARDSEREALLAAAQQVAEYTQLHQDLHTRLEDLARRQVELALHSHVEVSGEVFTGPELRIGERLHRIETDTQAVRFQLQDVDGRTQIEINAL